MWPRMGVCLALLVVIVAGCGLFASPTATPEPARITYVYPTNVLTPHFEALKSQFEADNPGVEVVLRSGNPYSALSGTGRADVVMVDQLAVASLAQSGLIRAIDPLVQDDLTLDVDAFYPGTLDALTWRGQLWGLPADVDPWVLYYNRDLFDAAGVPYPTNSWTWDDLLEAALQLSDPLANPPVYGLLLDMTRADFVPLVYQNGGTLVDSLVAPREATFTDPRAVEAIEWYADLALRHGVAPTPRELSQLGGFERMVVSQRAAMWYGPLTERGGDLSGARWNFQWGLAVPPGRVQQMTLLSMRAYALSSQSSEIRAAWQWLVFIANHPPVTLTVPPLKQALESGEFRSGHRPDVAEVAIRALEIGRTIPPTTWVDRVGVWLGEALQRAFSGEMPVAEALAQVQERAAPVIAAEAGR
ncbi:MAG: extracellular solute-binding protein [Anaerolineae bacterium]|nr:extracellular solute-binding protein [Anaerolineae bacterium]